MQSDTRHPEYQYLDLMRELLEEGEEQTDIGVGAKTFSQFGRQFRFDAKDGFPLLTTKRVYWKGVLHELYWFLSGQSNIKYLVDNDVHIWDDYPYFIYSEKVKRGEEEKLTKEQFIDRIRDDGEFAAEHGELPHIYGELWRRWPAKDGREVDQLGWIVQELKDDSSCHNAVLTAWNPEYLYGMAKEGEVCRFPICHNMFQFNIKNGRLCLQLYQRSADIFLGVPFNIGSYALLMHIIARIIGYEPGEFIHTFGDVHIYSNHFEPAREQLTREPKAFPSIHISEDITSLDLFRPEHVTLEGYEPHGTIKAEFTVIGGGYKRDFAKENNN